MKSTLLLPILAVVFACTFISCSKERPGKRNVPGAPASTTLNVTVAAGQEYKLNLADYGTGQASIVTQASAFSVSEINFQSGNGYVYRYKTDGSPKAGETKTDKVVLKIVSTSEEYEPGSGQCEDDYDDDDDDDDDEYKKVKKITIHFTIN